jgi:penicillin-binding protein 1A
MKPELLYDYNSHDQIAPPGAEGADEGNGGADEYLGAPDDNDVPVESKLSLEEQKVLKESGQKKTESVKEEPKEKKKKGFFKRLFGKKKDD